MNPAVKNLILSILYVSSNSIFATDTPLIAALRQRNEADLIRYMKPEHVNEQLENGLTPLHIATAILLLFINS